jgi:hypothetical protein
MTDHDILHKIKFIGLQLKEAKDYSVSVYANDALFKAIATCGEVSDAIGKRMLNENKGEERV